MEKARETVRRIDPGIVIEGWNHPEEVFLQAVRALAERERQAAPDTASPPTSLGASSPILSPESHREQTQAGARKTDICSGSIRSVEDLRSYLMQGPFAVDATMEAFLDEIKDPRAQQALASGGLGFLAGETYARTDRPGKVVGLMPLYEHYGPCGGGISGSTGIIRPGRQIICCRTQERGLPV